MLKKQKITNMDIDKNTGCWGKSQEYSFLEINIPAELEEQVVSLCWEYDLRGLSIETDASKRSIILVYPEKEASGQKIKRELMQVEKGKIRIAEKSVNSALWQDKLEGWFEPVRFHGLRIIPASMKKEPDKDEILIMPGRGYGTGNHATTSMCLQLLKELVEPGMRVLDYGTGSGILSIASLKWGAGSALAIDNDGDAVENAGINFRLNKVQDQITLKCGSVAQVKEGNFRLIAANLNSWIIEGIFEEGLPSLLAEGGIMILSGIRVDHVVEISKVIEGYGLEELKWKREDKWTTVVLCKPAGENDEQQ